MLMKYIRPKFAYSSLGEKRMEDLHQLPDLSGEKVGARFIAPVVPNQTSPGLSRPLSPNQTSPGLSCPLSPNQTSPASFFKDHYRVRCSPTKHHWLHLSIIISAFVVSPPMHRRLRDSHDFNCPILADWSVGILG